MDIQDTERDTGENGLSDQPFTNREPTNGTAITDENIPPNGDDKKEYKDGESITVFHDPQNFNVKHPLMHEWTLWFTKPPSGKASQPVFHKLLDLC